VVVHCGVTWRDPLAETEPTPLSISTDAAPVTSQVKVTAEPFKISPGLATNFWTERFSLDPVRPPPPQPWKRAIPRVPRRTRAAR
jgi:hypothetical protein